MLCQEALALAVAEAEEKHVDIVEGHLAREAQVGITVEPLMHIGDEVSGIALTVDEDKLCLGVVDEQADELSCRIAAPPSIPILIILFPPFILFLPDACRSRREAEWRVL